MVANWPGLNRIRFFGNDVSILIDDVNHRPFVRCVDAEGGNRVCTDLKGEEINVSGFESGGVETSISARLGC